MIKNNFFLGVRNKNKAAFSNKLKYLSQSTIVGRDPRFKINF